MDVHISVDKDFGNTSAYAVGTGEIWVFSEEEWLEIKGYGDRSVYPPLDILDENCLQSIIYAFGRHGYFTIIVCSSSFGLIYSPDSDLGHENNSVKHVIFDRDIIRARNEVGSMFLLQA